MSAISLLILELRARLYSDPPTESVVVPRPFAVPEVPFSSLLLVYVDVVLGVVASLIHNHQKTKRKWKIFRFDRIFLMEITIENAQRYYILVYIQHNRYLLLNVELCINRKI